MANVSKFGFELMKYAGVAVVAGMNPAAIAAYAAMRAARNTSRDRTVCENPTVENPKGIGEQLDQRA